VCSTGHDDPGSAHTRTTSAYSLRLPLFWDSISGSGQSVGCQICCCEWAVIGFDLLLKVILLIDIQDGLTGLFGDRDKVQG